MIDTDNNSGRRFWGFGVLRNSLTHLQTLTNILSSLAPGQWKIMGMGISWEMSKQPIHGDWWLVEHYRKTVGQRDKNIMYVQSVFKWEDLCHLPAEAGGPGNTCWMLESSNIYSPYQVFRSSKHFKSDSMLYWIFFLENWKRYSNEIAPQETRFNYFIWSSSTLFNKNIQLTELWLSPFLDLPLFSAGFIPGGHCPVKGIIHVRFITGFSF